MGDLILADEADILRLDLRFQKKIVLKRHELHDRIARLDDFARVGVSVSSAGDINGDGLSDILVGAPANSETGGSAGAAYVIFGMTERTGDILLSDIAAGKGGFKLLGEAAGDAAGSTVAAAGDVNGDGIDDLIVGASGYDAAHGEDAGAAYVLFGGTYLGGQDHQGTFDDDTINIANAGFAKIDGKSGFDTLVVGGTDMVLDFTKIAQDQVSSIEMIDLTGHGNNQLTLTAQDVLDMSGYTEANTTSLWVKLDSGDVIDFSGEGWNFGGAQVDGAHTYDVFENAALAPNSVRVLIEQFDSSTHVY